MTLQADVVTLTRTNTNVPQRPPLRPPIGIPPRDKPGRQWTALSLLFHVLVIFLVVAPPVFMATKLDYLPKTGAGGAGPAGGGGCGIGGTGGLRQVRERMRFLLLPKPQAATPPVEPPQVKPETPPKVEPPKPPPTPEPPAVQAAPVASDTKDVNAVSGSNGGSGKDGTNGSGPGSGGGVGSGIGPGRGSGIGPGTGGGGDAIYPPAVISLPILPLPVPGKVRPYKMIAYFEVDTLGNARLLAFNPSNDGGYNKRIREMLSEIRFRPATRPNGRPVVDTAVVTAEAPR